MGRWGEGTPCKDVFEADDAKRKHEDLRAKAAALQRLCDASGAGRDRSRSPRPTHGRSAASSGTAPPPER